MPEPLAVKVRDFIALIESDGWHFVRHGRGNHRIYKHPTRSGIVNVGGQPGHEIAGGTLGKMLRDAGLTQREEQP